FERSITADDRSHDEGNGNMALRPFDQDVPRHDPVGRPKGAYPDPIVSHPPKSHDRQWRISQDRHRVSDIAGGDKVVIVARQDKKGLRHIAVASDEVWIEPYVLGRRAVHHSHTLIGLHQIASGIGRGVVHHVDCFSWICLLQRGLYRPLKEGCAIAGWYAD